MLYIEKISYIQRIILYKILLEHLVNCLKIIKDTGYDKNFIIFNHNDLLYSKKYEDNIKYLKRRDFYYTNNMDRYCIQSFWDEDYNKLIDIYINNIDKYTHPLLISKYNDIQYKKPNSSKYEYYNKEFFINDNNIKYYKNFIINRIKYFYKVFNDIYQKVKDIEDYNYIMKINNKINNIDENIYKILKYILVYHTFEEITTVAKLNNYIKLQTDLEENYNFHSKHINDYTYYNDIVSIAGIIFNDNKKASILLKEAITYLDNIELYDISYGYSYHTVYTDDLYSNILLNIENREDYIKI
jgi:hypothetical protein